MTTPFPREIGVSYRAGFADYSPQARRSKVHCRLVLTGIDKKGETRFAKLPGIRQSFPGTESVVGRFVRVRLEDTTGATFTGRRIDGGEARVA